MVSTEVIINGINSETQSVYYVIISSFCLLCRIETYLPVMFSSSFKAKKAFKIMVFSTYNHYPLFFSRPRYTCMQFRKDQNILKFQICMSTNFIICKIPREIMIFREAIKKNITNQIFKAMDSGECNNKFKYNYY